MRFFFTFIILVSVFRVGFSQTKLVAAYYGENIPFLTSLSKPEDATSLDNNYATIGSGATLQLKFSVVIPANQSVYVKADGNGNTTVALYKNANTGTTDVDGTSIGGTVNFSSDIFSIKAGQESNAVAIKQGGTLQYRKVYYAYILPIESPLEFKENTIVACGSYNLIENLKYSYPQLKYEVLKNGEKISSSPNIVQSGTYSIRAIDPDNNQQVVATSTVNVTINPEPNYTLSTTYLIVGKGNSVALPQVQAGADAGSLTSVFRDNNGNVIHSIVIPATTPTGFYTYTVTVNNTYSCSDTRSFIVYVSDSSNPCPLEERVYASTQSSSVPLLLVLPVGSVLDANNAVDANLKTRSNMFSLLNLLGITTFYQELKWSAKIPKGSTVTVKLSSSSSIANVLGGISIRQRKNGADVGSLIPVRGGLIDLLAADNETYFSFTATDDIDAVRLIYGGVLGVGTSVYIYDAWYTRTKANGLLDNCNGNDVIDVLSGAGEYLKGVLNAASLTSFVSNQWDIADDDINTFATMNSIAQVGTYIQTTAVFKTLTMPLDTTLIVLETNYNTLNLLGDFLYIQRFLGDVKVGAPIYLNNPTLITLLNNFQGTKQAILLHTNDMPYDKVAITLGGAVSVLNVNTKLYEIYRKPYIPPMLANNEKDLIGYCSGDLGNLTLQNVPCTTFKWYEQEKGGIELNPVNIVSTIKNTPGKYTYYIQGIRYGCTFGKRVKLTIDVYQKPDSPHLNIQQGVTSF
ncbi:hypothetical protein [Pseudopedobacter beijingensis]|uniref:Ig-like domain-containing protein n=1 Tax=Pseudopedobacter beijingensis TaxID=1207056 RepID=A0ABW4I8T3_9SPHI